MTLEVYADRLLVREQGGSRRHLLVTLQAPAAPRRAGRLPVNLGLVLDRSGSMAGDKLEMARRAAVQAVQSLSERDRVAVVTYDDSVETVVPSTPATAAARQEATATLERVQAGGSTDLAAGWLTGCEQVALHLQGDAVGRCLLLTDGLANQGITDHEEIVRHASALRERAVSTSTFGVGIDFDEVLLRRMAEAGGGHFYFVEHAEQIPDVIAGEVGESLEVVARDVALLVSGAAVESLDDRPCRREGEAWRIELGSLVSAQELPVVIRVTLPAGRAGDRVPVTVRVVDRDGALTGEGQVVFTFDSGRANDQQPRNVVVDRRVAAVHAHRTERAALEHNRRGNLEAARHALKACIRRIQGYAGSDPVLGAIVSELEARLLEHRERRDPSYLKSREYASYRGTSARSAEGLSTRRREPGSIVVLPASSELAAVLGPVLDALAAVPDVPWTDLRVLALQEADEARLVNSAQRFAARADVRIVLTAGQLAGNWFSHWHASSRTAVVSLHAWDRTAAVDPAAFLAWEVLHHGLNVAPGYDPEKLLHDETRGCLFDLCRDRRDVEIKLQAADLCEDCTRRLGRMGVDVGAVRQVAEAVRSLARPVVH
jgi:Ca-activated chloride channel family protein